MRMFFEALLCTAVALSSADAASASEMMSNTKALIGAWEINYDTDACHLDAKFGEDADPILLRLTRYQPGDNFDLLVYGNTFKFGAPTVGVRIGFGLAEPIKKHAIVGTAGNKLPMLIVGSLRLDGWESDKPFVDGPALAPQAEAKANQVDLQIPGGKRFRLETGSFARPMAAMRACTADLVKSWGYDPDEQANLSMPVKPTSNPSTWLTNSDYPAAALRAEQTGLVHFRLDIDAAGKVTRCHVLHRTKPDSFADLTCLLIGKRAKFAPARDKNGKAVASYYVNRARFAIPD